MKNVWQPANGYDFPTHSLYGKSRKFNLSWLQRFPWPAYSGYLDAAFCVPCILFGRRIGANSDKLDKLMESAFTAWSTALRDFNDHQCKSEIHKTSLLTMQILLAVMDNKIKPIDQIQDELLHKTVAMNRAKLSSIIKTILLCGRHNIPLRGHRDDSNHYDSKNCCNFQALLDFRIDSGEEMLK